MMSITDVLEKIGQQSNLKYSAEVDSRRLLTEIFVPNVVQRALVEKDKNTLSKLFGVRQDIVCFISSPSKEHDTPKDDNKPEPEDLPFPDESSISRVG